MLHNFGICFCDLNAWTHLMALMHSNIRMDAPTDLIKWAGHTFKLPHQRDPAAWQMRLHSFHQICSYEEEEQEKE